MFAQLMTTDCVVKQNLCLRCCPRHRLLTGISLCAIRNSTAYAVMKRGSGVSNAMSVANTAFISQVAEVAPAGLFYF